METLINIPSIRQSAAKAGQTAGLNPAIAARLCGFAALHGIGEAILWFRTKALLQYSTASDTKDMMQLLIAQDIDNQERLM